MSCVCVAEVLGQNTPPLSYRYRYRKGGRIWGIPRIRPKQGGRPCLLHPLFRTHTTPPPFDVNQKEQKNHTVTSIESLNNEPVDPWGYEHIGDRPSFDLHLPSVLINESSIPQQY